MEHYIEDRQRCLCILSAEWCGTPSFKKKSYKKIRTSSILSEKDNYNGRSSCLLSQGWTLFPFKRTKLKNERSLWIISGKTIIMRLDKEGDVFFQKKATTMRMLEEVYVIFKKSSMFSLRNLSGKKQ